MEYNKEKWLEKFTANYKGQTEEAKELQKYVKDGFQGGVYIPWAVMQRMIYMQDPEAQFIIHENPQGGTVWEDLGYTITIEDGKETRINWTNKFVKVSCQFMGRVENEYFPIQGQLGKVFNGAPKTIDQNMVNKAIQRAKAKAAALASGLGLSLYENGDLQFEPDEVEQPEKKKGKVEKPKMPEVTPTPEKTEELTSDPSKLSGGNSEYTGIAGYIKENKERLQNTFMELNVSVAKNYGFVFDLEKDTLEEIADKLGKVKNGNQFFKAVLNKAGYSKEEINEVFS